MQTRNPTVAEAVEIMNRTITREQKLANIAHWRGLYGDAFAEQILDHLRALKKKEKL